MAWQRHSSSEQATSWPGLAIGSVLLAHFVAVCAIKSGQGIPGDVLWMSHVALVLAGAGLLLGSRMLWGAALTAIAIPHGLWLFDLAAAQIAGVHPLRITIYLQDAKLATWIATAHHFYLLPLLAVVTVRSKWRYGLDSFVLASALVIVCTLAGRVVLPRELNVNYAHAVLPGVDLAVLRRANAWPAWVFLPAQLAWQIGVFMAPTAIVLRLATRRRPRELRAMHSFDSAARGTTLPI